MKWNGKDQSVRKFKRKGQRTFEGLKWHPRAQGVAEAPQELKPQRGAFHPQLQQRANLDPNLDPNLQREALLLRPQKTLKPLKKLS